MANSFLMVKDTDNGWNKLAYGIVVGGNYGNYRAALIAHMSELLKATGGGSMKTTTTGADGKPTTQTSPASGSGFVAQNEAADPESVGNGDKYQYHHPSVSDASVGGNDAINPYCAFCQDDDIVHDISRSKDSFEWGMGRCYGEMYESKQQILYLTMGVPRYRNLQTWLQNATDKEMSEANDTGGVSLSTKIGRLVSSTASLAIKLPWLPLFWGYKLISGIKDDRVTEYFYFRDTMPMYYRYVNTLLSEIAVNMGINSDSATSGANISSEMANKYTNNLPTIMKEGPDIFKIMCRRAERMGNGVRTMSTDDLIAQTEGSLGKAEQEDKKHQKQKNSVFTKGLANFWTGLQTGALEGMNFIGFRIERSDNANESFSNSTQESPLLQQLNAEVAQNRETNLGAATGGKGGLAAILKYKEKADRFLDKANKMIKGGDIKGTIAYVASGNGYFDLPKQWGGASGCTRSLSFNMKLRAKTGGDNVSVYQSIMIPLACIMAAALPRGVGDSTYTSPFLVRAFCKGMFSVPAGIITTLTITRGSGEFGWSLGRVPTVVDVSFTIDDLSPMIFLSIAAGTGAVSTIYRAFQNNTKLHDYINTLTGIGAKERYYKLGQLKRRLSAAMLINKNTTFSATYRGYVMGDSAIIRSLMAVFPWTRIKNN